MKAILLTVGIIAVLSTLALVYVDQSEKPNLEKFHIHIPTIKLPTIGHLHLKVNIKDLGDCASVVAGGVASCGAAVSSDGTDIIGDVGCVQTFVSARSCAHVF